MFSLVPVGVSMFRLYGERFYSEGLGWVGWWGCCGVPLILLPIGFIFVITIILYVILYGLCDDGIDGQYIAAWGEI